MQKHTHAPSEKRHSFAPWVIIIIIALLALAACTPARSTDGRWTENGASQTISTYFRALYPDLNPKVRFPVEEITPPEVWESMQVQIFRITDDVYANETFLFNDEIMLQMGTAFGGTGVTSMLVSQLYQPDKPALIFTYNFGSGISQSHIAAYMPSYDASSFMECEYAYQGDLQLTTSADGAVIVEIVEPQTANEAKFGLPKLGTLAIVKDSSQLFLDLSINPSLPQRYLELLTVFK